MLRDVQLEAPAAYCRRCGAELYRYDDGPLCPGCEQEEREDG